MAEFLGGRLEEIDRNSAKHWYIIEILIKGFGELLDNGNWYPGNISPLYDFSELRMYYLGESFNVKLKTPEDFPVLFTIEKKNFDQAHAHVQKSYEPDEADEFKSWIKEAKANDQDLVLYYY